MAIIHARCQLVQSKAPAASYNSLLAISYTVEVARSSTKLVVTGCCSLGVSGLKLRGFGQNSEPPASNLRPELLQSVTTNSVLLLATFYTDR